MQRSRLAAYLRTKHQKYLQLVYMQLLSRRYQKLTLITNETVC